MSKQDLYFVKQKVIGLILLVLTALIGVVTGGDFTVGLFTVPMGLTTIFTKSKMVADDYFFEK